jgi:hypothetical protein
MSYVYERESPVICARVEHASSSGVRENSMTKISTKKVKFDFEFNTNSVSGLNEPQNESIPAEDENFMCDHYSDEEEGADEQIDNVYEMEDTYGSSTIPIEPFHMNEEDEEGHFDEASGQFIWHMDVNAQEDSWLSDSHGAMGKAARIEEMNMVKEAHRKKTELEAEQADIWESKMKTVDIKAVTTLLLTLMEPFDKNPLQVHSKFPF